MATTISNGESGSSVRAKLNDIWAGLQLNEIDTSIADTAVDVFVYDTSKDSDGGAWRKRTQHTSWYNETLNTATRGSRREFPAVAVIVAESNQVTIYDGDDPSLPMWMVFDGYTTSATDAKSHGGSVTSISALNGLLEIACDTYTWSFGVWEQSFISDKTTRINATNTTTKPSGLSNRNTIETYSQISSNVIVNANVNDVAMTVLPNAPIDAATGLPVPTIAVATDGGVSVIKDDGTVADINSVAVTNYIEFSKDYKLCYLDTAGADDVRVWYYPNYLEDGSTTGYNKIYWETTTPSLGVFDNTAYDQVPVGKGQFASGTFDGVALIQDNGLEGQVSTSNNPQDAVAYIASDYNTGWMNGDIKLATLSDTDATNVTGSELVTNGDFGTGDLTGWTDKSIGTGTATINGSNQLEIYRLDGSNVGWAQQAITTVSGARYLLTVNEVTDGGAIFVGSTDGGSDLYNAAATSGVNIVMFTAASTTTYIGLRGSSNGTTSVYDDVSVRLAEEDRSVNGNGLQVFGTVTKAPVATGAELVAYSGFSASNYLMQPYNSDLDFGTGDFCVMGWMKTGQTATTARALTYRAYYNGSAWSDGLLRLEVLQASEYNKIRFTLGYDGFTSSHNISGDNDVTDDVWHYVVAVRRNGITELWVDGILNAAGSNSYDLSSTSATFMLGSRQDNAQPFTNGSLALWRISATAPTAEAIKKIYNDEKVLFQDNAAATLYGASDAVTALAHDSDTGLLHVGTSAGRSVFQGLRRVSNTTTAVGTAISASNGLVVEE